MSLAVFAAAAAVIIAAKTLSHAASSQRLTSASTFPGYPGQTVTVYSIAGADGTWLAAGSAGGHPAIWLRERSGAWRRVSVNPPKVSSLYGALTSIASGPKGWIAVGYRVLGKVRQPVVVTSPKGLNWRLSAATFPGPSHILTGVAADRNGYVVVGQYVTGKLRYAATWWSTDLQRWTAGVETNNHLYGGQHASTVYAVAATATGKFVVAAGTHFTGGVIWTSTDNGQHWELYGINSVSLSLVAVNGSGVAVAAGYAVVNGDEVPIVAVSTDGGQQWSLIKLQVSRGSYGTVTALTETDSGFLVAGQIGPAGGAQRAVTWNLRDSSNNPSPSWGTVPPVSRGVQKITALSAIGGAAQEGQAVPIVPAP